MWLWQLLAAVVATSLVRVGGSQGGAPTTVALRVDHTVLAVADPRFVSISYDASFMRRREEGRPLFDIGDSRLHNLLRALKPALLRIGGTAGDHWQFADGPQVSTPVPAQFNVSATVWDEVVEAFAHRSGLELIVGLNALTRDRVTRRWDPLNAQSFVAYNSKRPNGNGVVGYELGARICTYSMQCYP